MIASNSSDVEISGNRVLSKAGCEHGHTYCIARVKLRRYRSPHEKLGGGEGHAAHELKSATENMPRS